MTLSDTEFELWIKKNGFSDRQADYISCIRASQPVRAVSGGGGNVCGIYPSEKMGRTIQFESHRVELAGVIEMEYDPDVLEFYDQPCTIKQLYKLPTGKNHSHNCTPDFFVIKSNSAGFEEWKKPDSLTSLCKRNPNQYYFDEEGKWRCPPGEAASSDWGLFFKVRSSKDINWKFQRNAQLLRNYSFVKEDITGDHFLTVWKYIMGNPGTSLQSLLLNSGLTPEIVYQMIYRCIIRIDLTTNELLKPESVLLAAERRNVISIPVDEERIRTLNAIKKMKPGDYFSINGSFSALYENEINACYFVDEESQKIFTFSHEKLVDLYLSGHVFKDTNQDTGKSCAFDEKLKKANRDDIEEAARKAEIIEKWDEAGGKGDISDRTIRHWKNLYSNAEKDYGSGFIGLLPSTRERGNRKPKLQDAVYKIMHEVKNEFYETPVQVSKQIAYGRVCQKCLEQNLISPSYKTVWQYITREDKYVTTLKRKGKRAAYKYESYNTPLIYTTPVHGVMPFDVVYMDHTELDIELIDSMTGMNLGRPWWTVLIDGYSRRIVGMRLTYANPSYESVMMALWDCAQRFGKLPVNLVVDNGPEFKSKGFISLAKIYGTTIKWRPPAESRFGSLIERFFRTTNEEFIHNLVGNTKITKNVREVTAKVNPKKLAVFTLQDLHSMILQWCYEFYDTELHGTLGRSPRDVFNDAIRQYGQKWGNAVDFNETFKIWTMPEPRGETVMIRAGQGVQFNNIRYWNDLFRGHGFENMKVEARYNPCDASVIYVFLKGQWIACKAHQYAAINDWNDAQNVYLLEEKRARQKFVNKEKNNALIKRVEYIQQVNTAGRKMKENTLNNRFSINYLDHFQINEGEAPELEIFNQLDTNPALSDFGEFLQEGCERNERLG